MKLELSRNADIDLTEIWIHNAEQYSVEHADKYREFLHGEMQKLKTLPELGQAVESFPNLRYLVMKRRAGGHGHVAYYEVRHSVIWIVRVLHTAMHAADHL